MNITKNFLRDYLERFGETPFLVRLKDGEEFLIGDGSPQFKVIVNNDISKSELLKSTSLALGEAYINRDIEIEGDLFLTLNLLLRQIDKFNIDNSAVKHLLHSSNSMRHQKKEIHAHYDIGNDFYSLWLDNTLSYSCAYFRNDNDTLYEAQVNKVHHILTKLNLKEGMSLLDIGCGWGFLLIEAAKKYKIHGVGITLSEEQYKEFNKRIQEENLQDYLEVKLMDYRELKNSDLMFDRVVSVGMLEHVGRENYELFIKNVNAVLKDGGLFLLHYISGLKESYGDPWIKKYIFPGGVIPSLREMIHICSDYKYHTIDLENLRLHYVKTLLYWQRNFYENLPKIKEMFDDKFIRMWDLYLCSCAAAFNTGIIDIHQILFTKGIKNDLPLTREYMYPCSK